MLRSSAADRHFLPQLRPKKNLVLNKVEPIYIPELDRYKWQINSYVSKRRERWYESLGSSKEELHKHHDNVNLLRDYTNESKIIEKKKLLEQNKSLLIRDEEQLKDLIDASYDNVIVQLINEAKEAEIQRKILENRFLSLKEAYDLSARVLLDERILLEDILACKNFILTLIKDNTVNSVDMQLVFDDFEERTKCFLAETSVKSIEIQKLSKTLSITIKHWVHDVDELKIHEDLLSSQISKEDKRLTWLKQMLINLSPSS